MAGARLVSVFAILALTALTALTACQNGSSGSRTKSTPPPSSSDGRDPGAGNGEGFNPGENVAAPIGRPRPPSSQLGTAPEPATSCANEQGWHYCVHRYAGNNPAILYYVHGFTDSHYGWLKGATAESTSALNRLQTLLGDNSPTVVVISYVDRMQDSWMLSLNDRKTRPPQLSTIKHFTTEAMPVIEGRFNLRGPRYVYGMSMGGFNATQLCLNAPQLWSKCVIQNAVLVTCDPYQKPEWMQWLCLPSYLIRKQFTAEEWPQNDPLRRVERISARSLPSIMVTNAREDQFNLFETGHHFATQLKARGARVKWHPIEGEHRDFDADAVYKFIIEQ